MNETLTRLFHKLTVLSEAESEDPSPPPSSSTGPARIALRLGLPGWTLLVDPDIEALIRRQGDWGVRVRNNILAVVRYVYLIDVQERRRLHVIRLERVIMGLKDPNTDEDIGEGRRVSCHLRRTPNPESRVADYQRSNISLGPIGQRSSPQRRTDRRIGRAERLSYHGVSYSRRDHTYVVSVRINNVRIHIGSFTDEVAAAEARDRAIIERNLDLEFPNRYSLNFPRSHYGL